LPSITHGVRGSDYANARSQADSESALSNGEAEPWPLEAGSALKSAAKQTQ